MYVCDPVYWKGTTEDTNFVLSGVSWLAFIFYSLHIFYNEDVLLLWLEKVIKVTILEVVVMVK